MWGVPDDVEDVKPWMIIHKIVAWSEVKDNEAYVSEDGEQVVSGNSIWFPVVLSPCPDRGGHGPAHTWYGSFHCSSTRVGAVMYATRALRGLKKQRDRLHEDLESFVAEQ